MLKSVMLRRYLVSFVLLALSTATLVSCGDDPVTPPDPNLGKKAMISTFHANYDNVNQVRFRAADSLITDTVGYGSRVLASAQIGEKVKVAVAAFSGTSFVNAETRIDSAHSTWVIYSGDVNNREITVSSIKRDTIGNATLAGIRVIHASRGTGEVNVNLESAIGTKVAGPIKYQSSSTRFTAVPITTAALVILTADNNTPIATLGIPTGTLEGNKLYTVVIFGTSDNQAVANKLTARLFAEP